MNLKTQWVGITAMNRWKLFAVLLMLAVPVGYLIDFKIKGLLWQYRFDAGRRALAERRFPEARSQLEAVVARARSFGARDVRLVHSLLALGHLDLAEARDEDAEGVFREALAMLDQESLEAADALSGLAVAAGHRARDAEAGALIERALAIRRRVAGPEHPDVARSLNDLAWLACNEGHYREAERLAREALAIREKTLDPGDMEIGRNLNDLAYFLITLCRFEEASSLLERARGIIEPAGDPAMLDLARCLNARGVLDSLSTNEDGLANFFGALTIRERVLGTDHPDVAAVLGNLGTASREGRRHADARKYYERSVRIFEKTAGVNSPGLAWTLTNFSRLALEEGRVAEAEALVRRALKIREQTFRPDHPEIALARCGLAEVELKKGDDAKAGSIARRALPALEGADLLLAQARCLDILGRVATRQRKFGEAEDLFKRSLQLLDRTVPYPHPPHFEICHHVAELFHAWGREDQARAIESSIRFIERCGTVRPTRRFAIEWSR